MIRSTAGGRLLLVALVIVVLSGAGPSAGAHPPGVTSPSAVEIDPVDLAGNGTAENPYVITNASELQAIEDDLDAHYVLGSDIGASGTAGWNEGAGFDPIGVYDLYEATDFTGVFDGNGHAITGLTIARSGSSEVGLFGAVEGGTVRHVRLVDVNVTGSKFVGGLVGYNKGTVRTASASGRVAGSNLVGGLVGTNIDGTVAASHAGANVSGGGSVGGLAGQNFAGVVNASYASGHVEGGSKAGGLVGFNRAGTVRTSYASGRVEGSDAVGGLVGARTSRYGYDPVEIDSYWDANASRQSSSAGNATGLPTEGMTSDAARGNMTGFDFGSTWQTRAGSYPVLAWQGVADNEPPRPRPDTYAVSENGVLSVSAPGVLENDTDPNGDSLSVEISPIEPPSNGSLTLSSNGSFEYRPDHGFFGRDTFTYEVTDGSGGNATTTVTIDVAAVAVDVNVTDLAGNGTTGDPYVITNASELQAIEDDLDAHYVLGADIDASGTADWNGARGFRPIAAGYRTSFTGTFDGDRHTIAGLTIDRGGMDDVGLFADVGMSGTIRDVALVDVTVNGDDLVGALAGRSKDATISHVDATEVAVSGSDEVGGLVGYVGFATEVRYASAIGTVEGSQNVGGLVGSSGGSVSRSFTTGAVTGDSGVGGLVGDNLGAVRASYANVTVSGNYDLGGLVGVNGGTTARSYATGSVTGSDNLAGLVGRSTGTVRLSYATANVTQLGPTGQVAGVVADTNADSVTGSYWDVNATGIETSPSNGSVPLTTARMTGDAVQGNMTALDFSGTWQIRPGGYPGLAWDVNDPPAPRIDSNRTVAVGANVTFDARASSDDVRIVSYDWDIDGDGAFEYAGERIAHAFVETGNATVTLRVTDDDGATNRTTRRVEVVTTVPPQLTVRAPGYVIVGRETPLRATASDRDGRVEAISWDTDADGTVDQNGSAIRTSFGTTGDATVVVTATDRDDATATKRVNITVAEAGAWSDASRRVRSHPRFRVDRANTGHHTEEFGPVADVTRDWSFGAGGRIFSSPVVAEGIVYTASYSTTQGDRIVAVDAENGSLRWEFSTTEPIGGNPTVYNETVYIGSDAGVLYALDANTGNETWSKKTGTVQPAPVVVNGTLYAAGGPGLYALDPEDGSVEFTSPVGGGGSSPALANGTVYLGDGRNVSAVDAETGAMEWTVETDGQVESSPAVVDGTVYVGSHDGRLYALDATNGFERWRFGTGNRIRSSPAVANGTVYVGSDDGFVYAVDAATGEMAWRFETSDASRGDDNRVVASPVVAGETVYVGTHGYYVHALDADDGTERWSYQTGFDVVATPAVVDGRIYVGSVDGNLYALSGTLPEWAKTPTADAGGDLLVTEDETIRLSGTGSTDPNGDSLAYSWTQRGGPDVSLAASATATSAFTAPPVESPTALEFELAVRDGNGHADTDRVRVVVNPDLEDLARFDETVALEESRVDDASLVGAIRAAGSASGDVGVSLDRATETTYSLSIDGPSGASNVTFYLDRGAISSDADVSNLTMYLDGTRHPFSVLESSGPDNGSWLAFEVPQFSTRTVTFENESAATTCVAKAVSGTGRTVGLTEIQAAIDWWAQGTEVPDTGGETIGLAEIQSLIDAWASGATVSCDS